MNAPFAIARQQNCTVWFEDHPCQGKVCLITDENVEAPFWAGRVEMETECDPSTLTNQIVRLEFDDGRSGTVQIAYDLFSKRVRDFQFFGPLEMTPVKMKRQRRTEASSR